jgi:PIN domain nuclease of toxin-antitoxin system
MPTADRVLLDTHVLLWWKADPDRLSPAAVDAIAEAAEILLSPISCWEVAMLVEKKRVALDRPTQDWIADVLAGERLELAQLTASVAVAAAGLVNLHGDPADRFIVATAEALNAPLVTKDRLIHSYADGDSALRAVW